MENNSPEIPETQELEIHQEEDDSLSFLQEEPQEQPPAGEADLFLQELDQPLESDGQGENVSEEEIDLAIQSLQEEAPQSNAEQGIEQEGEPGRVPLDASDLQEFIQNSPPPENPEERIEAAGGLFLWNPDNQKWEINVEKFGIPDPKNAPPGAKENLDIGFGGFNGVIDATQSIYDLSSDALNIPIKVLEKALDSDEPLFRFGGRLIPRFPEANTIVGDLTNGMTQFLIPFSKIRQGLNATKGNSKVNTLAAGVITDVIAFDENEERLSNLVEEFPALQNPVTEYLASDPNDNFAEGRLKQALEGLFLSAGSEVLVKSFTRLVSGFKRARVLKESGKGKESDAVLKETQSKVDDILNGKAPKEEEISTPGKPTKKNKRVPEKALLSKEQLDEIAERFVVDPDSMKLEEISDAFNIEKWKTTEDANKIANEFIKVLKKSPEAAETFGSVKTFEKVRRMAVRMNQSPEVLLQNIKSLRGVTEDLDAVVTAGLVRMNIISDQIPSVAKKYTQLLQAGEIEGAQKAQEALLNAMNVFVKDLDDFKGLKKNIARAQGAGRIEAGSVNASGASPDQVSAVLQDFNITGDFDKFAKKLSKLQDKPNFISRSIEYMFNNKVWDIANEIYINGILSGPATHVTNATFTGLETLVRPSEKIIGAVGRGDLKQARIEFAAYHGMVKSFRDSFELGMQAFKQDNNVLDPLHAVNEIQANKAIAVGIGETRGNVRGNGLAGGLINMAGEGLRLPTRFLLSSDEVFKQLNYRSQRYKQGIQEGLERGLKGKELQQFAEDRITKGFDESGAATDKAALKFAQESTFTNDLEFGIGKDVQNIVTKYPSLRQIAPFIRTPINLFRNTAKRTPLGLIYKDVRADLNGVNGTIKQSEAWAKMLVGHSTIGLALHFASSSYDDGRPIITGGHPRDRELRQQAIDAGIQEYSFNLPNGESIAFDRADPRFAIFGLVADMNQVLMDNPEVSTVEMFGNLVLSVTRNLSSKTYLKSLGDIMKILETGGDDPERSATLMRRQIASRVVPFSSLLKQVNPDNEVKELRSAMDAIIATLPGYSEEVEARRNVLGKKVYRPEGFLLGDFSPIKVSKKSSEMFKLEMARLGHGFPSPAKTMFNGRIDLASPAYKNSKGQAPYDRWQELVGTIRPGGLDIEERLDKLVNSESYQKSPDLVNVEGFVSGRVDMIREKISDYQAIAKARMLKEFPTLQDDLRSEKSNQRLVKRSNGLQRTRRLSTESGDKKGPFDEILSLSE